MLNQSISSCRRNYTRCAVASLVLGLSSAIVAHAQSPNESSPTQPSAAAKPQAPVETAPAQGATPNEAPVAAPNEVASDSVPSNQKSEGQTERSEGDIDATQASVPTTTANTNGPAEDSAIPAVAPAVPVVTLAEPGQRHESTLDRFALEFGVKLHSATRPSVRDTRANSDLSFNKSAEKRILGATLDVGLPDGLMLGLAVRPVSWLRFQAAGGTNAISPGVRAGVSLR